MLASPAAYTKKEAMKLRLRCCGTKETIKIELPDPCTFHHLKELLCSRRLSSLSPFSFSLNGSDFLQLPSHEATLQSFGITSGDLVFFSAPKEPPSLSEPAKLMPSHGLARPTIDDPYPLIELVRAVFEDSSFVSVEPNLVSKVTNSTPSLVYTLPPLLNRGNLVNSAKIKIQTLQNFTAIYGSLTNSHSPVYRTCLFNQTEVPELRRKIKDHVAYPLLIELSDAANLPLPPCWTVIPTDLKYKVVEMLPATDIAKLGCVCKEMSHVCSSQDIWKKKYVEEFGYAVETASPEGWKQRFARIWERQKRETYSAGRRRHLLFRPIVGPSPPFVMVRDRGRFIRW